jgi:hypothetical protein
MVRFTGIALILLGLCSFAFASPSKLSPEGKSCLLHGKLESKQRFADYTVRILSDKAEPGCVEILKGNRRVYAEGDAQFRIGAVYPERKMLHAVPMGTDITGDHQPDLVLAAWTGGAHCCFIFSVFEIGTRFRKIAELNGGDGDYSHFEDIRHNGVLVFVTNDWNFDYWNTSFAESPAPEIKLEFRDGNYVLASDLMRRPAPSAATLKSSARNLRPQELTPWGAPPSALWARMLELIYSGHLDLGMEFLDMAWNPKWGDKAAFRKAFLVRLSGSSYWPAVRALSKTSKN